MSKVVTDAQMKTQKKEFDEVSRLCQAYRSLPPIVDDDYPEMRSRYEGTMQDFIRAIDENGRLDHLKAGRKS